MSGTGKRENTGASESGLASVGGVLAHLRDPDGNILTLVGTAGAA